MNNQIEVVVTGLEWMGSGTGSIESAMERIFRDADDEILITSYSISNSTDIVLEWLVDALSRGVIIRIVVNQIQSQPLDVVNRLSELSRRYTHFYLYSFEDEHDLHAKAIVADRRLALVGSSNISHRGLIANHELALFVQGKPAEHVASTIDKLLICSLVHLVER